MNNILERNLRGGGNWSSTFNSKIMVLVLHVIYVYVFSIKEKYFLSRRR